jgi:two-component system response regulator AtoC
MSLVTRAASAGIATVLIRGESGTGKELLARSVHERSPRAAGPFVKVHCAALPEQLLESELFGYEKGAFTGANQRKLGRVELAQGGTLFLDEIGDISPATQVKLLRIIQDREFERLGGTETLKADVRFVTATHRNLEEMVRRGEFREDLYYRLNVVQLVAPPLRDRREDIPSLVVNFCASVSVANGRGNVSIDDEGVALMKRYDWPGNVRQLQNFIERLVVLAESDTIEVGVVRRELSQLNMAVHREPSSVHTTSVGQIGEISFGASVIGLEVAVRKAEKRALEKALKKSSGNRTVAARILGVSRRTLYNKLQEHGLT